MDNPTLPVQETPPSQAYTASQPVSPPPSAKSFLSNKIILLTIILLILFGAGGTYLALNSKPKSQTAVSKSTPTSAPTPTTDPTANPDSIGANWKTYTNQQNKFSFKYPPDWIINLTADTISILSPNKAGDNQQFHVDISKEVTSQTLQEWLRDKSIGGKCCGGDFTLEETKINDQQFYKVKTKQGEYPAIITRSNGVIYYLTTESGYSDGGVYYFDKNDPILMTNLKIFGQILSTFKFLQASPTPTCRPRPSCLDATPRCLIPETSDMCPKSVVCTQDAKQCPDGSYVGRQGLNCEFAPCPGQ